MNPIVITSSALQRIVSYTDNPTMPLQQLSLLLCVLDRGEVPMADLPKAANVAQSSTSRNVAILGPGLNPKERGYGLIEAYEDPEYRRRKLVKLTARGEALKRELKELMR